MGVFNFPNLFLRTNPVLPTTYDDTLSYYETLGKVATNLNKISEGMNSLADALISPYSASKIYNKGDYAWENEKLYKCNSDNVTGEWNTTKWDEVVFVDSIANDFKNYKTLIDLSVTLLNNVVENVVKSIAPEYSEDTRYFLGDYVSYSGKLYTCIVSSTYDFVTNEWETIEALTYSTTTPYYVGAYCIHGGSLYICTHDTIGEFNENYWDNCNATPFRNDTKYNVDDYVVYGGTYYKCIVNSTGEFDEDEWREITVVEDLNFHVEKLWNDFITHYQQTLGIVNEMGNSTVDAMSQNATTIELLKRLTNMGTFNGENIADITDENSIYALIQSNTYSDYPDLTAPNGFVITIRNVSMWAQLFISYTTIAGGTDNTGKMWYRSGQGRKYNEWVRINTKKSELDALSPLNNTGNSTIRAMSQNATTIELLKRLTNMGTFNGENIADITDENSIYALIQSNTYNDYPDSTAPNGFVITIRNVSMWAQLFISYTTTNTGTDNMGKMWYRSGQDRKYNEWVRINQNSREIEQLNTSLNNRVANMGTLPTGRTIASITDKNSIYALIQSNTYGDYPDPDVKNGFVITINNVSMWAQLFITYTTTKGGTTNMGNVWYRSGAQQQYNQWVKLNQSSEDIAEYVKHVNYPGTATTPTSITAAVNGNKFYTSYILPAWVSEHLNNISDSDALSEITFGGNNRAFIGVQRNALRLIVGNATSSKDVVKNATVKLTSYEHKIAMFGDSITWGRDSGQSGVVATSHTFDKTIARNLGVPVYNYGVGSQGWLVAAGSPSYTAYEKIANTDITTFTDFILAWGVNDRSIAKPNDWALLGDYNTTDETTLIGQMYKTVNYIYTQCPNANVIIIAPWFITKFGSFPLYGYEPTDYATMANKMSEFCSYYGLPFISMKQSPLNGWTAQNWLLDNVHPNTDGYKVIGQWLAGEISNIIG